MRTSAARYARALLDVALAESDPAKVEESLADFLTTINTHADLSRALSSPSVPASARRQIVEQVATKGGLETPVVKLLALLAERNRLELVPDLLDVYRERLLAHKNMVEGSVTAAAPLAPAKVQALEQSLSSATGKQVKLAVAVDPALIGGVVARIGGTVYDGSVRTQLQRMRQELVKDV